MMKDAQNKYHFNKDIDNSEEEDLDDDELKQIIQTRKRTQRELRNNINITLEAIK